MGDSYQPIYDAVRSRISNGDIGAAVESALRDANLSWHAERVVSMYGEMIAEHQRPSALFRPALSRDGDHWCALLGTNLQEGVSGFGKSPDEAMREFDRAFYAKEPPND